MGRKISGRLLFFTAPPQKSRRLWICEIGSTSTCLCYIESKKHCDSELTNSNSNLRYYYDFHAIFLQTRGETANCNLRFGNAAICNCDFWGAEFSTPLGVVALFFLYRNPRVSKRGPRYFSGGCIQRMQHSLFLPPPQYSAPPLFMAQDVAAILKRVLLIEGGGKGRRSIRDA